MIVAWKSNTSIRKLEVKQIHKKTGRKKIRKKNCMLAKKTQTGFTGIGVANNNYLEKNRHACRWKPPLCKDCDRIVGHGVAAARRNKET